MEYFNDKDIVVVGISGDRASKLRERMCHYKLVLLSDLPKHRTAITYKAFTYYSQSVDNFTRKVKINQPITYLINSNGKIVWKYVGTRENRPPNATIKDAVEQYL